MRFRYRPLAAQRQEIRLLTIHGAKNSQTDSLRCTLDHVSLLDELDYETTSYCCGDQSVRSYIYLNGCIFDLPLTAEQTLRRIQYFDRDRVVWIDAVCISQDDIDERSQQVVRMHEVYSRCRRNLIWLGEAERGDHELALQAIDAVARNLRSATDEYKTFNNTLYDELGRSKYNDSALTIDFEVESLTRFFACPWFRRLWIVQEAVLAPTSLCHYGSVVIDLLDVLRVARWLMFKMELLPFDATQHRGLVNAAKVWDLRDEKYSSFGLRLANMGLLELLQILREFHAFDAKDHLFALAGLYQKFTGQQVSQITLLVPDYRKSLMQIFRDATRHIIQDRENLTIFVELYLHPRERREEPWLTWVPRWHKSWDQSHSSSILSGRHQACGDMVKTDVISIVGASPDELTVAGLTAGKVMRTTPIFLYDNMTTPRGMGRHLFNVEAVLDEWGDAEGRNPENQPSILGEVLTAGVDSIRRQVTPDLGRNLYLAFAEYMEASGTLPPGHHELSDAAAQTSNPLWLAANFVQAMRNACNNRRFFALQSGQTGIGPKLMKSNDYAVILYGCPWPVVLRSMRHGLCKIIGLAYIHGMMSGEYANQQQTGRQPGTIFRIL